MYLEGFLKEPLKVIPIIHQVAARLFEVHLDFMIHADLRVGATDKDFRAPLHHVELEDGVQLEGLNACGVQHLLLIFIVHKVPLVLGGAPRSEVGRFLTASIVSSAIQKLIGVVLAREASTKHLISALAQRVISSILSLSWFCSISPLLHDNVHAPDFGGT